MRLFSTECKHFINTFDVSAENKAAQYHANVRIIIMKEVNSPQEKNRLSAIRYEKIKKFIKPENMQKYASKYIANMLY